MNNPRFLLTSELADTILTIHDNGMFQIKCSEWAKLYKKARVVVAKQRVEDKAMAFQEAEEELLNEELSK